MNAPHPAPASPLGTRASSNYLTTRPLVLSLAKVGFVALSQLPRVAAYPVPWLFTITASEDKKPMPASHPTLWIYLAVALALVLLGGVFAGLTIALMGQDEIYLQVIKTSGEPYERKHATRVLRLLTKGKHWVLVTLLLGNVITNETLPIVLDRSLGGGWPAVLGSTALIVIFGEIIPQSVCVRYGLPIGAWMSPLVLVLMWILAPVAWPTAKLLDKLLGEDHGTTYKKAGLKTLVTLHKSLGAAGEQLNEDEVTIISAVLDLKAKPVGDIMTPMETVFTMSADTVLDEITMEKILGAGYSRIPIHAPENKDNFVGMLLVKMLITYDPEDAKRVRDFSLATLPETRAETSCLDIVNFFQEGKSHMVLVSEYPGDDHGALGVVTLEDVIEELIGEEIIDESDVFIDVHKSIRRLAPAPYYRVPKGEVITDPDNSLVENQKPLIDFKDGEGDGQKPDDKVNGDADRHIKIQSDRPAPERSSSPKLRPLYRRTSSMTKEMERDGSKPRQMSAELKEHLKHLGPSNVASRPRSTRYNTVKIKPGAGTFADSIRSPDRGNDQRRDSGTAAQGGIGAGIVSSAGKDASDGVLAVQSGYGTMSATSPSGSRRSDRGNLMAKASEEVRQARMSADGNGNNKNARAASSDRHSRTGSHSTLGSMDDGVRSPGVKRGVARSGSITEQIVEAGGVRKTVLETTSSSSDLEEGGNGGEGTSKSKKKGGGSEDGDDDDDGGKDDDGGSKDRSGRKKRRRRKRKPTGGEGDPLLD